jgi:hypothetical protein
MLPTTAGMLLDSACDRHRGIYVPLTSHPFLKAKLTEDFASVPTSIRADVGNLCLFGNPLLLPENFDDPHFVATDVSPVNLMRWWFDCCRTGFDRSRSNAIRR